MAQQLYDRTAEDLGNLVGLEHVNLKVNNQGLAAEFYLSALGLTRDPFMFPGTNNMWVNVGNSQFHLPTGDPNVLRGHVGLVVPSLEELCERLGEARKKLADTKFDCKQHNAYVEATCPWGNKFRLYEPDEERFGAINLGMPMSSSPCRRGRPTASRASTARFSMRPPASRRMARAAPRMSAPGRGKSWCSARPTRNCRNSTATICRSMPRSFRARMTSSKSAA